MSNLVHMDSRNHRCGTAWHTAPAWLLDRARRIRPQQEGQRTQYKGEGQQVEQSSLVRNRMNRPRVWPDQMLGLPQSLPVHRSQGRVMAAGHRADWRRAAGWKSGRQEGQEGAGQHDGERCSRKLDEAVMWIYLLMFGKGLRPPGMPWFQHVEVLFSVRMTSAALLGGRRGRVHGDAHIGTGHGGRGRSSRPQKPTVCPVLPQEADQLHFCPGVSSAKTSVCSTAVMRASSVRGHQRLSGRDLLRRDAQTPAHQNRPRSGGLR